MARARVAPVGYLNKLELAALLGVNKSTVTRWRNAGKIPAPEHMVPRGPACLRFWSPEQVQEILDWRSRRS